MWHVETCATLRVSVLFISPVATAIETTPAEWTTRS
jgi:hypothetical protein